MEAVRQVSEHDRLLHRRINDSLYSMTNFNIEQEKKNERHRASNVTAPITYEFLCSNDVEIPYFMSSNVFEKERDENFRFKTSITCFTPNKLYTNTIQKLTERQRNIIFNSGGIQHLVFKNKKEEIEGEYNFLQGLIYDHKQQPTISPFAGILTVKNRNKYIYYMDTSNWIIDKLDLIKYSIEQGFIVKHMTSNQIYEMIKEKWLEPKLQFNLSKSIQNVESFLYE